jgi:hypothetical protein
MRLADLGPGHYVACRLPDGRHAIADAGNPGHARVVAAVRRVNRALIASPGERCPGSPEDYAVVVAWLDQLEPLPDGQLFTREAVA